VHCSGSFPTTFTRDDGAKRGKARGAHGGGLEATMHSQVIAVSAVAGAAVKRGDVLVTLEAMKMEMRVVAPHDGVVTAVCCKAGEVVERGRVLVEMDSAPS
jgi:glutaconyl-CoA/methylmalonyl-CoA decarboxylase subunit gamma